LGACEDAAFAAARSGDQHILLAQWRERAAEFVVVLRTERGLDAQLHDRNIGIGIHQHQRHPGAVIEAASVVELGSKPGER